MFHNMLEGLSLLLTLKGIFHLLSGGITGLVIGILPGLGPVFGVALFLPLTFWMAPHLGLIFLGSLYACCVYGGSITAILLGIPGTPGSLATVIDGHEMSKKGNAGVALGVSATSSLVGGVIGVFSLALFAPVLAEFAVKFSPADFFNLALFGLSMVAVASKDDTLKGLMLGSLGVLSSTIGLDLITGTKRFTFGIEYLAGGVPFIPAVIGLFALSQTFVLAEKGGQISRTGHVMGNVWEGVGYALKHWYTVVKNALIGTVLGAIPGIGISITNFIAYMFEKKTCNATVSFGKGNPSGVIAPESANNACVSSQLIPAFALGIPGGSTAAIFLAAVTVYGLSPGYTFFIEAGPVAWALIAGLLFAQFLLFLIGVFGANIFAKVTLVPAALLVPAIVAMTYIGGFADRSLGKDLVIVLLFGVVGYILKKYRYPVACLVLGMVLGPLVEKNFYRALRIGGGDYRIFISTPVSIILWALIVLVLAWGFLPLGRWFKTDGGMH